MMADQKESPHTSICRTSFLVRLIINVRRAELKWGISSEDSMTRKDAEKIALRVFDKHDQEFRDDTEDWSKVNEKINRLVAQYTP